MEKKIAEKNAEVERLKTELKSNTELIQAQAREMLKEEVSKKEAEIERLKAELKANTELVQAKATETLKDEVAKREAEIAKLKEELKSAELAKQLALKESISDLEKERDDLRRSLELKEAELKLREATLKEKYETQIRDREETIERLKDLKAKLSTKMVGKRLNNIAKSSSTKSAPLPSQLISKRQRCTNRSKGDYIFREYDDNGTELISIMFEMKTKTIRLHLKEKRDFFKNSIKIAPKRVASMRCYIDVGTEQRTVQHRNCRCLLSLSKMYVIRPQFSSMITLLRNAALNTLKYKNELAEVKAQNIDIANFEEELNKFKKHSAETMS